MTARTVQLIGHTIGTELRVTWNGRQVFEGEIPALGDTNNLAVLAEWQCDTVVTGNVPLQLENIGSNFLTFASIYMNHVCSVNDVAISDQAAWTKYTPNVNELAQDIAQLSAEDISAKYGLDRFTVKSWLQINELVPAADNFIEPFVINETHDGKINLRINGEPYQRHNVDIYTGAWQWAIHAGQNLSCDIVLDPAVIGG